MPRPSTPKQQSRVTSGSPSLAPHTARLLPCIKPPPCALSSRRCPSLVQIRQCVTSVITFADRHRVLLLRLPRQQSRRSTASRRHGVDERGRPWLHCRGRYIRWQPPNHRSEGDGHRHAAHGPIGPGQVRAAHAHRSGNCSNGLSPRISVQELSLPRRQSG